MNLSLSFRLARRELRGGLKGFRIFIICLALGVAAIAAIATVKSGLENGLRAEGATLLGGDAEAELTYRFASDIERQWLEAISINVSEIVNFRSMLVVVTDQGEERALTEVKAVDSLYPLKGAVRLVDDLDFRASLAPKEGRPGIILEQVLVDRLGLVLGDQLQLGAQSFHLGGVLVSLPDAAGDGFGLGARSLVYAKDLEASGLLAPGTFFSSKYRLELPDGTGLDALAQDAAQRFENAGLRWRDGRNGAPGISAFVERLGAFLILVGLSGLAVGGVGVASAVNSFLTLKTSVIATLRSLGASNATVFQVYFIQITALAVLGIGLGLVLGVGLPIAFAPLIERALPFPVNLSIYPTAIVQAALYGILTAYLFTLWPLARLRDIRPVALYRDQVQAHQNWPAPRFLLALLLLFVALVGAASFFTGSVRLVLWAAGGIFGTLIALYFSAYCVKGLAKMFVRTAKGRPALRWALASLYGPREATGSIVLALGLGLTVLASIGQIDGNLRGAITTSLPKVAPSYFFVDIQKSQMQEFEAILSKNDEVSRIESAPMLRGVITKINGLPAKEVAGDHWVLQGDRGVTYSEAPVESSKVVAGEWWPEGYTGENQISFGDEEAAEMGLSLGDTMTINIMGRDIEGRITSFRDVNFSTAGIGFVVSMNPAALRGAPHSFIATVYMEETAEPRILREISRAMPNITAVRVKDAITRVSELLRSIASAITYGAIVTLCTGFIVLIGAAASGEHHRRFEAAVLKSLGATRTRILQSFALRAAIMGIGAGAIALLCGIAAAWALCYFLLDTEYAVIWSNAGLVIFAGLFANVLANLFFALRALYVKPAQILRNYE